MSLPNESPSIRPVLAWTIGDVAGIGPEIVAKAWRDPEIHRNCRVIVIGSTDALRRVNPGTDVEILRFRPLEIDKAVGAADPRHLPCIEPPTAQVAGLPLGRVHAAAGQAAHDYLVFAIDLALAGHVDAIVTLPLNKESLHAARLPHPGHTEILAERTGTRDYGMMLYRKGLGVLHVTLHMALREAIAAIDTEAISVKISLLHLMMRHLGVAKPRLAVAALNPHASDGGLFGQEEATMIAPAVALGRQSGLQVVGPIPADTLFVRAAQGEFDGVVAMYHDQGHIALKLLGWREAVNITVGLPIIRTSVAHGTGYDIVGQGKADPSSLKEAVAVAIQLCRSRQNLSREPIGRPASGNSMPISMEGSDL